MTDSKLYRPVFFRTDKKEERNSLETLKSDSSVTVYDEIEGQLRELIKMQYPSVKIRNEDYPELIRKHLNGRAIADYGVWVFYPWSKRLIHLLDEQEFVEVRTNRNVYKITREEQATLKNKKIGVIGLSVGQSIVLTMAIERTCGELRLADFDTVELSNLNRIRTGLHNLGKQKTIIAAQEIAEIDPFINVKIFNEGITDINIDAFFTEGGKLDLLVEVCDGLDVKILSRFKARSLGVPVVMDTNDRGMLDIERYDLEPQRPLLHGLAGDLVPEKVRGLSNEGKVPYILKMIGAQTISTRLKASMMEIEQTIVSWPQLASSVTLGGALTTDVARRILLDQFNESGRYYVDFDELISGASKDINAPVDIDSAPAELTPDDLRTIASMYSSKSEAETIDSHKLNEIVAAACAAPSGGNAQPWKFLYRDNRLFIYHDAHFSHSLLDVDNLGSYIAFGAVIENIEIRSAALGIKMTADIFPLQDDKQLVAVVSFMKQEPITSFRHLSDVIGVRCTNRTQAPRKTLDEKQKTELASIVATVKGADLKFFDEQNDLDEFEDILTDAEKIRFLHERGHYDTFVKELRFTREEVEATADGLDIETLEMSNSDKAALQIARDYNAIGFLHKQRLGKGFKKVSGKLIASAAAIGVISTDGHSAQHFLKGGRALERLWLEATNRNISFQPITQVIFMMERYMRNGKNDFDVRDQKELSEMVQRFSKLVKPGGNRYPVFVFRLFFGEKPREKSLRKPISKLLFVD